MKMRQLWSNHNEVPHIITCLTSLSVFLNDAKATTTVAIVAKALTGSLYVKNPITRLSMIKKTFTLDACVYDAAKKRGKETNKSNNPAV